MPESSESYPLGEVKRRAEFRRFYLLQDGYTSSCSGLGDETFREQHLAETERLR